MPNRPPRPQKSPAASGTVQLATPNGFDSDVISAIHTICRDSRHSLAVDSSVITTKSRTRPSLFFPNSASSMPSSGNTVWAPTFGERSSLPICGYSRFSGVGSFGPSRSFCRSTICKMPPRLVPYPKYTRLPFGPVETGP